VKQYFGKRFTSWVTIVTNCRSFDHISAPKKIREGLWKHFSETSAMTAATRISGPLESEISTRTAAVISETFAMMR
jgi:hypothetical protein